MGRLRYTCTSDETRKARRNGGRRLTYVVHLEVESAGVADGVAVLISSPQRGHVRLAVRTSRARSPRRRLYNVHAVVKAWIS